ncbi:Esterase/lipase [Pediococcus damnosus]|uniref:Esterase/lipase n=2 Tax=Pediococcus damnosus TaxID=51663 RepID=A0A0R2HM22_9LACO|nr:Mbeg1-like protein [Pediococcus damnosus]AMV60284.1 Esterase/lipase [Pediococcus damnosus]AMV62814.1 Esterase/lipase [Pediococcus damnosus]AMV64534.1 Esterase/lipase [Pediococcus damnosus]AMV67301.1 Esterase/lipase [Pediococcus damnosus]KJU74655.1 hypothetical protein AH70_05320 [Pediococcus damnosus LMG 28219]
MSDLLNYLDNYNRPITPHLNVADQMLLSRLPFFPFENIVSANSDNQIYLPEALKLLTNKLAANSDHLLLHNDRILIEKLSNSFRFKKIALSDFQVHHSDDLQTQYAAISITIEPSLTIIAFRGADGTQLGWQADMSLVYTPEDTSWQTFSLSYLSQVASTISGPLQLIGFSKGGSMATAAALKTTASIQDHLQQVVNFDGPQGSKLPNLSAPLQSIFYTYLPQLPFFGLGSNYPQSPQIISSQSTGIWQHDLYSWQIPDTSPTVLGMASSTNPFLNQSLRKWLCSLKQNDARLFINTFWDILNDTQAVTVNDLIKHWQQVTKLFQNQSKAWDPVAQEMGQKTLQAVFQIIVTFTRF